MIVVNAVITSKPQDIAALQSAIHTMEVASREETGCDDYTFSVELNDPNMLRITEKWHSVEALKGHMATSHMAKFQNVIGAHPPASMEVTFYEVTEIQPF